MAKKLTKKDNNKKKTKKVTRTSKKKRPSSVRQERIMAVAAAALVLVTAWTYLFDTNLDIDVDNRFTDKQEVNTSNNSSTNPRTSEDAQRLASVVIPEEGYTVNIKWGDTGRKLVQSGGIDMAKYEKNYSGEQWQELLTYLTENKDEGITITRENAYFWVNTLWALGLTQRSDVLDKGIMGTEYADRKGNFASTGGWTLGSTDAVSLYSSTDIIPLTAEQQQMVADVSENIYRPCCGNPTSFPDCNHGMAILGLLELMASQGFSEEEMYEASLAFNSYWFTQTYMDLAYYFETKEGVEWEDVDAKLALSAEYSSAPGYQNIRKQVGDAPKLQSSGGSCGA